MKFYLFSRCFNNSSLARARERCIFFLALSGIILFDLLILCLVSLVCLHGENSNEKSSSAIVMIKEIQPYTTTTTTTMDNHLDCSNGYIEFYDKICTKGKQQNQRYSNVYKQLYNENQEIITNIIHSASNTSSLGMFFNSCLEYHTRTNEQSYITESVMLKSIILYMLSDEHSLEKKLALASNLGVPCYFEHELSLNPLNTTEVIHVFYVQLRDNLVDESLIDISSKIFSHVVKDEKYPAFNKDDYFKVISRISMHEENVTREFLKSESFLYECDFDEYLSHKIYSHIIQPSEFDTYTGKSFHIPHFLQEWQGFDKNENLHGNISINEDKLWVFSPASLGMLITEIIHANSEEELSLYLIHKIILDVFEKSSQFYQNDENTHIYHPESILPWKRKKKTYNNSFSFFDVKHACTSMTKSYMKDYIDWAFIKEHQSILSHRKRQVTDFLSHLKKNLLHSDVDDLFSKKLYERILKIDFIIGYPEDLHDPSLSSPFGFTTDTFIDNLLSTSYEKITRMKRTKSYSHVDLLTENHPFYDTNAHYHRQLNSVVINSGLLLLSRESLPISTNKDDFDITGLGFIIAHEISHSVDKESIHFYGNGSFISNAIKSPENSFFSSEYLNFLVEMYSKNTSLGNLHNGKFTLNENIADSLGFYLIERLLDDFLKSQIHYYTKIQINDYWLQFYTSFAESWCEKSSILHEKHIISSSIHSISQMRCDILLNMSKKFNQLFQCM